MQLSTRKMLDRSFTGLGVTSIVLMSASLAVILLPIVYRGVQAFVFRGTVEHREFLHKRFGIGETEEVETQVRKARLARAPVFEHARAFREELETLGGRRKATLAGHLEKVEEGLYHLFGPNPLQQARSPMPRDKYGQTRWDRTRATLDKVLYYEDWDYSGEGFGEKTMKPRKELFAGTSLEPMFDELGQNIEAMMLPEWTFYWGFFTLEPVDANLFGGIWPCILGTFYLTVGAMIFAVPMGVLTAVYLAEYADPTSRVVSVLRTFISTLAGVPSIVFGLFGLAFFINFLFHKQPFPLLGVSHTRNVLAGSLTLGLLILPTVIRASEEAIRAVPMTYKEAALSVGAGKWRTVVTVILPAALPGILTGTIISMGRAAGETAPIIFTAAVSLGPALAPTELFSEGTPALPWNIYSMATEHEAEEEVRHVQYGMATVLVAMVLALNVFAIWLRARVSRKLRG